jgi:hypothetical protein
MQKLVEYLKAVQWNNLFVWMRDTFGGASIAIFAGLKDQDIAALVNVALFTKLGKWCAAVAFIGLILNRAADKGTWPQAPMVTPPAGK